MVRAGDKLVATSRGLCAVWPSIQQNPIGLAGGLNLYGFAAGDPVNFADPFGLSPCLGGPGGAAALGPAPRSP